MTPNPAHLMSSANQAHAEGRLNDCEQLCRSVLDSQPGNVSALVLLGVVAAKKEEPEAAVPWFKEAIRADPRCAPAYQWLSMVHRRLGQKPEALARARDAVALNPNDALGQHHLGQCLLDLGEFAAAEASFRRAASMAPTVALVHYSLGLALQGLKRNQEAIAAFRRSARFYPSSLPTLAALRQILLDESDPAGAAECARTILKLQPGSAEANLWLARALLEDNKAIEADTYVQTAMELEPDSALAHSLLGSALQVKGDLEEAERQFRRSIELQPRQGFAYQAFAANRKMTEADRPMVEAMKELTGATDLSPLHQSQLQYGVGKALEDLGEYAGAMHHFDEANRISYEIKFGTRPYDRKNLESYERTMQIFTAEFLEHSRDRGSSTDLPIFVVGMIRSGTTLAEQILSSHPQVGAAGEQPFWLENGPAAFGSGAKLDFAMIERLASRYEMTLRGIAPGKAHVVDKMPMNFQMIGLIRLAFPKAKIIHTQRHPVDTCLSIYTTPNRTRLGWAHDKGNIVFAYEQYQRLMEHWRRVLPPETMMEVRYEELVSEPERTTRSMIEFCGLAWNDACLRPELNERSVVTPSVWQVRQPVYKTSVDRWRKY